MSLTLNYTVFGGMIAIAIIYLTLKKFNVENYWRGVISFSATMLAYGIYASSHWAGVDTLTIHVAVYSATATVASLIGMKRGTEQNKLTWVPKLFVLFFIALGIFNAGLLIVGTNGISDSFAKMVLPKPEDGDESIKVNTGFAGTVEHGDESAKAISSELKKQHKLNTLGWDIDVNIANGSKVFANQPQKIQVSLSNDKKNPISEANITLSLKRPGKTSIEKSMTLHATNQAGIYETNTIFTDKGLWIIEFHIIKGHDQYKFEKEVIIDGLVS